MTDIAIEFGAKTDRFKRDLRGIEVEAQRTARAIERSFRDAEIRGWKTDPGVMRTQRLAAEREIEQRLAADRRAAGQRWIAQETETQGRLASRTQVYTERRTAQWEAAEARRARASQKANQLVTYGLGAVAFALRAAIRLADDYTERWGDASAATRRFSQEIGQMRTSIGQDLQQARGALAPFVGWLERARSGTVNLLANAANLDSMHSIRVDEANQALRARRTFAVQNAAFERERLMVEAGNAEARGDTETARAIRDRLDAQSYASGLSARQAAGELSAEQVSELAALRRGRVYREGDDGASARRADREAMLDAAERNASARQTALRAGGDPVQADREAARVGAELAKQRLGDDLSPERRRQLIEAIDAQRDAELERITAEQRAESEASRQRRADALESYRLSAEEARADSLRAEGRGRQAESLREELRLQREIHDILRDDRITEEDRQALIDAARDRSERTLDRISRSTVGQTVRTVQTGVAERVHLAQALGPAARDAGERHLRVAERQLAVLEEIRDTSGVYA